MRARGGFEVSMRRENRMLKAASVTSALGNPQTLRAAGLKACRMQDGTVRAATDQTIRMDTEANQNYELLFMAE